MPLEVVGLVAAVPVLVDLGDDLGSVRRTSGEMRVEVVDVDPDPVVDRLRIGGRLLQLEEQDRRGADVELSQEGCSPSAGIRFQESRPNTVCSQRAAAAGSS